jgi:tripartite-type tricarboxylate transporter receptor subunit TctC
MKFILTTTSVAIAAALALGIGPASVANDASAAWKPQKPVEFVIMAGKGGGADRLARFIQGIIKKQKLSNMPFVPINKGGGSGAEALRYLRDKAGDSHVIMATLNSYYTTPLRNPGLGVDISKFTPIARLAEDTFQLWVHSDDPIKNVNDYVAAVKKAGQANWKMGGTGKGQEDSLVTAMIENTYGVKVTYVPFKGGGTVAKQLIGKHINSTVNNPSEQMGFWQAGKSRPLATFTPTRLKAFPNVPTFRELGHDLVYFMQRSVVAPPGVDREVQDYYVDVFAKVYKSADWQNYLSSKGLLPGWLTGDKLTEYFVSEREAHRKLLKSMGEIQ